MRTLCAIALLVPLALAGCKKDKPVESTATETPAAPAVAWKFGPASYTGGRLDGDTGKLKVPVKVTNNTDTGLVMSAVRIGIMGADGKEACSKKEGFTAKDAGGGSLMVELVLDCAYKALPAEGKLTAKVTAMYTLGGDAKEDMSDQMIPFTR